MDPMHSLTPKLSSKLFLQQVMKSTKTEFTVRTTSDEKLDGERDYPIHTYIRTLSSGSPPQCHTIYQECINKTSPPTLSNSSSIHNTYTYVATRKCQECRAMTAAAVLNSFDRLPSDYSPWQLALRAFVIIATAGTATFEIISPVATPHQPSSKALVAPTPNTSRYIRVRVVYTRRTPDS